MIKKRNYSELLAEKKIIAVKKMRICKVVGGEKGIEGLWQIKQQKHIPRLIAMLKQN